ncbi:MAG: NUDIX domain-containing protein [Microgenomates group bacterium]|jgi:8-oxo-dGTP diphosphatase
MFAKQNYEQGNIAVDAVIFTVYDQNLLVYLNTREKEPFKGLFELPGGLLLPNETAEDTLSRKLKDIVENNDVFFEQFRTFTKPKRDPRGRTISIGFIALVPYDHIINTKNLCPVNSLSDLAFDHIEIIMKAQKYLEENTDKLARQFMPKLFPINDLQIVYEVAGQKKLDNRNFRKKVLDSGVLKKMGKTQKNVTHRPANLYQFK